jgi:hypothetical protein
MKKCIIFIIVFLTSCYHTRRGQVIKTEDGKFYMLEAAPGNEAYFLNEIDTSFFVIKFK